MDLEEKIQRHLPLYLNPEDRGALFEELKSFPDNIDQRIYTNNSDIFENNLLQGDGVDNQKLIFLPDTTIKEKRVFIISNTCDIDLSNPRIQSPKVIYCPIIKFSAYKNLVESSGFFNNPESIQDHLTAIRKQRITSMFYLPSHGDLDESIALLDSLNHCRLDEDCLANMIGNRVFSLGNYGFYLFLVKLSIHLNRIEEGINRG